MTDQTAKETQTCPADQSEAGYILIKTSLVLIPLLIFAAFATDLGFWYAQGQKSQKAADAAALAGAPLLPDLEAARAEALRVAESNGFVDSTPANNDDFESGGSQIEVKQAGPKALEVRIRRNERSFLGELVLDEIVVERYAVAKMTGDLHIGNPSSVLGSGSLTEASSGVPGSRTWLAISGNCSRRMWGDMFMARRINAVVNENPCDKDTGLDLGLGDLNPTYNQDEYVFVVETKPESPPIDLRVYDPGFNCSNGNFDEWGSDLFFENITSDKDTSPKLFFEIYGPNVSTEHRQFVEQNSPIGGSPITFPQEACWDNRYTTGGDANGWFPLASNLSAPADGGFYYIKVYSRSLDDAMDQAEKLEVANERYHNHFSLMARHINTDPGGCIFSSDNATCPQLYALDWMPFRRNFPPQTPETQGQPQAAVFYLTEVSEEHAGGSILIRMYDVADGTRNVQFVNSKDESMNFEWRYADKSLAGVSDLSNFGGYYRETNFVSGPFTCTWGGSGSYPCHKLSEGGTPGVDGNEHMVEVKIDIPSDYTCGDDCWWKIRYTSVTNQDRSTWSVRYIGDPLHISE